MTTTTTMMMMMIKMMMTLWEMIDGNVDDDVNADDDDNDDGNDDDDNFDADDDVDDDDVDNNDDYVDDNDNDVDDGDKKRQNHIHTRVRFFGMIRKRIIDPIGSRCIIHTLWEKILRFLGCTMIQVILDH